MLREYYALTKPGIIYGNALTAAAGFFIAAGRLVDFKLFLLMLAGASLVVAAGCVFNNIIDRDIDALMERTKNRPMVREAITVHDATAFGIFLTLIGGTLLYFTNILTLAVALFGLFIYVVAYSLWGKEKVYTARLSALWRAQSPPVIGYTAVTNSLDLGAFLLFLILMTWQMPHALAIAIRRIEDYRAAHIPVMPVFLNVRAAKAEMFCYTIAFLFACFALTFKGFTGMTFHIVMMLLALAWLVYTFTGFWTKDDKAWAKKVFLMSLVIVCAFCLLSAFNALLP